MNNCLACFQPQLSTVGICAATAMPSQSVCGAGVTCAGGMSTVTITAKPSLSAALPWLIGIGAVIYLMSRRR